MAPRRRTPGREHWPNNLKAKPYKGRIYYSWVDPLSGSEMSLKCPNDFKTACIRANALNAENARAVTENFNKAYTKKKITVFKFSEIYYKKLVERGNKYNTLKTARSRLKTINHYIGNISLAVLSVKDVSTMISDIVSQGKHRMAQSIRSTLIDMIRLATALGDFPENRQNPAEISESVIVKVKRERLTFEEFQVIIEHTQQPWERNAMLLSLVTGQDVGDLCRARVKQFKDWDEIFLQHKKYGAHEFPYPYIDDNFYYATRQKTGAMTKIPRELRLDALGMSINDVVEECLKRSRIPLYTQFLIHHTRQTTWNSPGDPVHYQTISRSFTRARNKTSLSWVRNPPTFKEIRSLSERLYRAQGVNTQVLLGHSRPETTEIYDNPRLAEWKEVK